MAQPGDSYTISGVGETVTFLRTTAMTGGRELAWRVDLAPRAHLDLEHVHPEQRERFTVVAGEIGFDVGGRAVTAATGAMVDVPPGTPHTFRNLGDASAAVEVSLTPALRTEEWMESVGALVRAGRVGRDGLPGLLQMAVILREYRREMRVAKLPGPLLAVLAALGRAGRRSPRHRLVPGNPAPSV